MAALWRLVQQAKGSMAADDVAVLAGLQEDGAASENAPLQLRSDPLPTGSRLPALDAATAERLMQRLMAQLAPVADLSHATQRLIGSLRQPGQQLAAAEPGLWASLDHPWWRVLDRLMAIGSVHADAPQPQEGAVTAALGQLTQRMHQPPPQGRHDWQAMADGVDDLIRAAARPGRAVSGAQRTVFLRQVWQGLTQADLSTSRVEAELSDLPRLLCDPPAAEAEAWVRQAPTANLRPACRAAGAGCRA